MNGLLPFLISTGLVGLAQGQVCPPAEVLAPCICNGGSISCKDNGNPNLNLKDVFDRASEFIGEDDVFTKLTITNLTVAEIKEGTFEHIKFRTISVTSNENLIRISPNAFPASWNVTTTLILQFNKLHNYFPRQRDIFELVNGFQNLRKADLTGNRITSIPANAFQNLQSLEELDLKYNQISRIGSRAFAIGSSNLEKLDLSINSLPAFGLPEDAFEGISTSAHVNLRWNFLMSFLGQKSYQALLERADTVDVGAEFCSIAFCAKIPYFVCDKRSDWICDNQEMYGYKLGNDWFSCLNGGTIWTYCAGRNSGQPEHLITNHGEI